MIISPARNFIFVHIPKTAGLSVTDAFGKYGRPRGRSTWRSITRRLPIVESPSTAHFRVHEPARKMISKLTRPVFDQFQTFSVVRNPYYHAISHYEYMKQFRIKSTAKKVGDFTFHEYLAYRRKAPFWNDTIFARMPAQSYYLNDKNENLAVDRLIRFENLNEELGRLARDLKLPGFQLKHVNKTKSKRRSFHAYYNEETVRLVQRIYDPDFSAFGYSRDLPE